MLPLAPLPVRSATIFVAENPDPVEEVKASPGTSSGDGVLPSVSVVPEIEPVKVKLAWVAVRPYVPTPPFPVALIVP